MGVKNSFRAGSPRLLRLRKGAGHPAPGRRIKEGPARRRRASSYDPDAPITEEDLKVRPWEDFLVEHLRDDPKFAAYYLDGAAESGDARYLLRALRHVVDAQGGIGRLARKTKLSRTTLYKTLSPAGNPGIDTLDAILGVYDLRIAFQPVVAEKRGKYRAKRKK